MKIAIIGSTGLVGSNIKDALASSNEIEEYNSSSGFDITDPSTTQALSQSSSEVVILTAAKANVDGCENDREKGEEGEAWLMNVRGVHTVGQICQATGKKLIYISTDFVFDGEMPYGYKYNEEDTPFAINWYGMTKLEGEREVQKLSTPWVIARIAYPYRAEFEKKKDFVRTIKALLEEGKQIHAVTDHMMCPTYIDDIAGALQSIIEKSATGIFHITGSQVVTPYEAAQKIAYAFDLDTGLVEPTSREEFFKGKAPRPYNLAMSNDKIVSLGVKIKTFDEGLKEITNFKNE